MLQSLNIQNVALIDRATLNFDEKLNVISGETGAGKSILLDSLSFVFGGRADKTLIRSGSSSMKVEAIFSSVNERQTKYIKENFNIDSEYNEETNTLHLYSTNVNESLELLSAKEYILSQIDESMLNVKYGF